MKFSLYKLLISFFIAFLGGAIGGLVTADAIPTWYVTLNKPFFNPPNWIFGPVWTLLYAMQAIGLYMIWSSAKKQNKRRAFTLFGIQVALSALWSLLFFGLKMPSLALIEIVVLWVLIYLTIKEFYKVNKRAGRLMVPYLLWVSFASILNLFIVLLN